MRNSLNPQYQFGEFRNTQGESFGRIARSSWISRPVVGSPPRSSANDADVMARDDGAAVALRALAANGFGEAALIRSGDYRDLTSTQLHASARASRSRAIGQFIASTVRAIRDGVRRTFARIEQRQQARATMLALSALDSHTLRDLGFHRSEIPSIAAEAAGVLEPSRVHAVQTLRGLS
jgi:uncharacterized protein YjiS (DUF1127 family)